MVQKIQRCIGKKLEEPWFKKFSGVLAKNYPCHGSKNSTVYWQKITRVMVQKI